MQALGAVGMARFLQQFDRGSGDYTRDRDAALAGITLEYHVWLIDHNKKLCVLCVFVVFHHC